MCNSNSFLLILAMVLLPLDLLFAQQLFFRHLGYEQGMNDLHSYHCTIDQNGFIWVATHEGIVRFNGKDITYYLHQTHPELPQDEISYVFCDSKNNIWASTRKGIEKWSRVLWLDSLIDNRRVDEFKKFDEYRFLFVFNTGVMLINTKEKKQEAFFPKMGTTSTA